LNVTRKDKHFFNFTQTIKFFFWLSVMLFSTWLTVEMDVCSFWECKVYPCFIHPPPVPTGMFALRKQINSHLIVEMVRKVGLVKSVFLLCFV